MKRSFAELSTQKKVTAHKERAVELRAQLETLPDISGSQFTQIEEFYTAANQWLNLRGELWSLLLSHPVPMKALQPGLGPSYSYLLFTIYYGCSKSESHDLN